MEPVSTALRLLQRQAALRIQSHATGGISILEERELFEIPQKLQPFPVAVQAILETAEQLRRPLDAITVRDVETHAIRGARNVNAGADPARLSS